MADTAYSLSLLLVFLLPVVGFVRWTLLMRALKRIGASEPPASELPSGTPATAEEDERLLVSLRGRDALVIGLAAIPFLLLGVVLLQTDVSSLKAVTLMTFSVCFLITWAMLECWSQLKAWRAPADRAASVSAAHSALVALWGLKLVPMVLLLCTVFTQSNGDVIFWILIYAVLVLVPLTLLTGSVIRGCRRGRTDFSRGLATGILLLDLALIVLLCLFLSMMQAAF